MSALRGRSPHKRATPPDGPTSGDDPKVMQGPLKQSRPCICPDTSGAPASRYRDLALEDAATLGLPSRSGLRGWLQYLFAPLPEAGGAGCLGSADRAVVEALVFRSHHVDHALHEGIAHPVAGEPGLEIVE